MFISVLAAILVSAGVLTAFLAVKNTVAAQRKQLEYALEFVSKSATLVSLPSARHVIHASVQGRPRDAERRADVLHRVARVLEHRHR